MAKYPYVGLPTTDGGKVYKSLIQVTLSYRKTHKITTPIYALIDSGADVCFCQKDIGIWLGINFQHHKEEIVFTAANKKEFQTKKETIILYVCGKNYDCPFYFSQELAYPIILGQKGFFDHFRISFDLRNKEIEII